MPNARTRKGCAHGNGNPTRESALVFGLREAHGRAAGRPFTALPEQFDSLETLENGTLATNRGVGFETVMLGHRLRWL